MGNYGTAVSVFLIYVSITFIIDMILGIVADTNSLPGLIIYYILNMIVSLITSLFIPGMYRFYMNLVSGRQFKVADLFYGFTYCPEKTIAIELVNFAITLVCLLPCFLLGILFYMTRLPALLAAATLLGIIGYTGIVIISLQLSQALFLMLDFPDYSVITLLKTSRELMKGQKGRLFYIQVSFIPLTLLALMSCGIGFCWLQPYMSATSANFYFDITARQQAAMPTEHVVDITV